MHATGSTLERNSFPPAPSRMPAPRTGALRTPVIGSAGRARHYTARLALDAGTRTQAHSLRYSSYHAAGHIPPNPLGLFSDPYDAMGNTRTVVLYENATPVGSVRVCLLAASGGGKSPAQQSFPDEVAALLARAGASASGNEGVEVTRLVRSPDAADHGRLVFLLYRVAGYLALARDFQTVFLCARDNHVPFYRRLGFQAMSEPKPYPGLSCPMRLLAATRAEYDAVRRANPFIDPDLSAAAFEGLAAGRSITLSLAPPA